MRRLPIRPLAAHGVALLAAFSVSVSVAAGQATWVVDDDPGPGVDFATIDVALAVAHLPPHHRDPFGRIQIAQAQLEGMTLISQDAVFERYEVKLL